MPWKKAFVLIGAAMVLVGLSLSAVDNGFQANIQKDIAYWNGQWYKAVEDGDDEKFEDVNRILVDLTDDYGTLMRLNSVFMGLYALGLFMVIIGFFYIVLDMGKSLPKPKKEDD